MDLTPWLSARAARRMSQLSRFAVASGRMALQDAGWPESSDRQLAVCLATSYGPANFVIQLMQQILADPKSASPFLFTDSVANAPSGQLAIAARARGANYTITQREAGPLLSVIQGWHEIRSGRCSAALVGSVDETEDYLIAILDRMRALAPSAQHVRPFDRSRCGFLLGEGAASLLLEPEAEAEAQPLARVIFGARGFDATATRAGWGDGHEVLGQRLRGELARHAIDPGSIDVVVSGASGSRNGDRLEGRTLRVLFGEQVPPVLLPKAVVGECGAGGVLAAAILALRGGGYCRPSGFQDVDPQVGVEPFEGTLELPGRILITGLGTGGAAAWVVIEAV